MRLTKKQKAALQPLPEATLFEAVAETAPMFKHLFKREFEPIIPPTKPKRGRKNAKRT